MANRARGEVTVRIGETEACLCLTLGALAEIQAALDARTLREIAARLSSASPADMRRVGSTVSSRPMKSLAAAEMCAQYLSGKR